MRGWGAHLAFGVILPVVAFLAEAIFGLCRDAGMDPMPTWWHAALVLFVPAANSWVLWLARARGVDARAATWADRANAWAVGVAACYAGWFAPMTPFAAVAVIFFGLGFLPLAPLLSLISALVLRRAWRRRVRAEGLSMERGHWHVLVGVFAVSAWVGPNLVTDWAVARLEEHHDDRVALAWLRHGASETRLLTGADGRTMRGGLWSWAHEPVSREAFRVAYFRATGRRATDGSARERAPFARGDTDARWQWDAAQGEQHVGASVAHLQLIESKLEGVADAAAVAGYTEWTLVFRNAHEFQEAEARALVQLPAGGVVSRLTLWVNGEEREAAFGGRAQVTQAYQAVVRQQRDPVLVTDKGADRVLMQCYPVPARHGEMKVRVGVTYPLALNRAGGRVVWPRVIEQNFSTPEKFTHAVWSVTDGAVLTLSAGLARDPANARAVRGELTAEQLATGRGSIVVSVEGRELTHGVVPDGSGRRVRQFIGMEAGAGNDLAIVLDGSAGMAGAAQALADALAKLPTEAQVALWVAGDKVQVAPSRVPREVAAWLREQRFVGGQDDTAALLAAHDAVAGRPRATVLWIHGPQPHAWMNAAPLVQRFARASGAVELWDYSNGWSENPRVAELAAVTAVRRIDPFGGGVDELARVLAVVREPRRVAQRTLASEGEVAQPGDSRQVGRLWAREEVDRLMRGDRPRHAEAVALAQSSQLVTSVTSAVVLETQAQFDAAGLKPVDPASTPSIPEPATAALVGGALALGAAWRWRQRRRATERV